MKKFILVIFILFLFINIKAQHPDKIIIFLLTDFETNYPDYGLGGWLTDSINPWVIDESNPDNIWQIGKPYKTAFDTAYTVPNAILTDTLNSYSPNNHSSFQFLITKPEWAMNRCVSHITLNFIHKFNTDTLKDGGYIDISYDLGETWTNIIEETKASERWFYFLYNEEDTLIGNNKGFSGNSTHSWNESGISLHYNYNYETVLEIDSIIIRFNFISDDIDNNKAGWIIDNIYFLIEDYCTIGINDIENKSEAFIYPNPVTDISILELPDNNTEYQIRIFNIQGQEVFNCISKNTIEINRTDFKPGIHIYKISNSKNQIFTGKFIVK